jgi:hypothetical protein
MLGREEDLKILVEQEVETEVTQEEVETDLPQMLVAVAE